MRTGRLLLASVLLAALASVPACGSGGSTPSGPEVTTRPAATVEYAPGLAEDLYLPRGRERAPLVVLVPGGAWMTADPTGLAGLAAGLAERGVAAVPTHIRAAEDGVAYPTPVGDVLCAVAAATEAVRARGLTPDPVAVLGHSSGAHLAALAVLAPDDHAADCRSPAVRPDALVGLSGPYDIGRVPDLAAALLRSSPADEPLSWAAANPVLRAAERPGVPVLLLHGEDDPMVAVDFTTQFGDALEAAGHPTTVEVVPGADHDTIYRADVSADRIADWLRTLP